MSDLSVGTNPTPIRSTTTTVTAEVRPVVPVRTPTRSTEIVGADPAVAPDSRLPASETDPAIALARSGNDPKQAGRRLAAAIEARNTRLALDIIHAQSGPTRQAMVDEANRLLGPAHTRALELARMVDPGGMFPVSDQQVTPPSVADWVGGLRTTDRVVAEGYLQRGQISDAERMVIAQDGMGHYSRGIFNAYEGKTRAQIVAMEAEFARVNNGTTVDQALTQPRFLGMFTQLGEQDQNRLRMMRLGVDNITPADRQALELAATRGGNNFARQLELLEPHAGNPAAIAAAYQRVTGRDFNRDFNAGGNGPASALLRGDRARYLAQMAHIYTSSPAGMSFVGLRDITRAFGRFVGPGGVTMDQVNAAYRTLPRAAGSVEEALRNQAPLAERRQSAALADTITRGGADASDSARGRALALATLLQRRSPTQGRDLLAAMRGIPADQRAAVTAELERNGTPMGAGIDRLYADRNDARAQLLREVWGGRYDAASAMRAASLDMGDASAIGEMLRNPGDVATMRRDFEARYGGSSAYQAAFDRLPTTTREALDLATRTAGGVSGNDALGRVQGIYNQYRNAPDLAGRLMSGMTDTFGFTGTFVDDRMRNLSRLLVEQRERGTPPNQQQTRELRRAYDDFRSSLQDHLEERGEIRSNAAMVAGGAVGLLVTALSAGTLGPAAAAALGIGAAGAGTVAANRGLQGEYASTNEEMRDQFVAGAAGQAVGLGAGVAMSYGMRAAGRAVTAGTNAVRGAMRRPVPATTAAADDAAAVVPRTTRAVETSPTVRVAPGEESALPSVTVERAGLGRRLNQGAENYLYDVPGDSSRVAIISKAVDPREAVARTPLTREHASANIRAVAEHTNRAAGVTVDGQPVAARVHSLIRDSDGYVVGYVTDRVPGREMAALIQRGEITPAQVEAATAQLRRQMEALHARGIVHGDAHPGNAMVDLGPPLRARFIDFTPSSSGWGVSEDMALFNDRIVRGARDAIAPEAQAREAARRVAGAAEDARRAAETSMREAMPTPIRNARRGANALSDKLDDAGMADASTYANELAEALAMGGREARTWRIADYRTLSQTLDRLDPETRLRALIPDGSAPELIAARDRALQTIAETRAQIQTGLAGIEP